MAKNHENPKNKGTFTLSTLKVVRVEVVLFFYFPMFKAFFRGGDFPPPPRPNEGLKSPVLIGLRNFIGTYYLRWAAKKFGR